MNRRRLLLVIGAVAGLGGVLFALLRPGPSSPAVATTTALGFVAMFAGLSRARGWLEHEPDRSVPADPEAPAAVDVPGTDFDRTLARVPAVTSGGRNNRLVTVRQTLREVAVDALTTHGPYDREEAAEAVDRGTWTDDRYAAELFATASGAGGSVAESVAGTITGEGPFRRRVARAATEIERLTRRDDRPDRGGRGPRSDDATRGGADGSPSTADERSSGRADR